MLGEVQMEGVVAKGATHKARKTAGSEMSSDDDRGTVTEVGRWVQSSARAPSHYDDVDEDDDDDENEAIARMVLHTDMVDAVSNVREQERGENHEIRRVSNAWVIDSGASLHMTALRELFSNMTMQLSWSLLQMTKKSNLLDEAKSLYASRTAQWSFRTSYLFLS